MKNKVLFTIDGYDVLENTMYVVSDKIDYTAPRGFIEVGASKVPGTGDGASCPFHKSSGIYNTGFEEISPRYYGQDKKIVASTVKSLRKNVLDPYMEKEGYTEEIFLGRKGEGFWDDYVVGFNENTKFNTAEPRDVLALYIAILSGKLAPKGHENKYRYVESSYAVDNTEIKTKRHSESIVQKHRAIAHFGNMSKDIDKLKAILMYSGKHAEYLTDEGSAAIYFENNLSGKPEKLKEFNDNVEFYESSEEGKTEVEVYRRLSLLDKSKEGKLVSSAKGFSYDSIVLGLDLKSSAKKLATTKDKELLKVTKEIASL